MPRPPPVRFDLGNFSFFFRSTWITRRCERETLLLIRIDPRHPCPNENHQLIDPRVDSPGLLSGFYRARSHHPDSMRKYPFTDDNRGSSIGWANFISADGEGYPDADPKRGQSPTYPKYPAEIFFSQRGLILLYLSPARDPPPSWERDAQLQPVAQQPASCLAQLTPGLPRRRPLTMAYIAPS